MIRLRQHLTDESSLIMSQHSGWSTFVFYFLYDIRQRLPDGVGKCGEHGDDDGLRHMLLFWVSGSFVSSLLCPYIFGSGSVFFLYTPLAKFFDFELYGSASLSLSSEIMKVPLCKTEYD